MEVSWPCQTIDVASSRSLGTQDNLQSSNVLKSLLMSISTLRTSPHQMQQTRATSVSFVDASLDPI